MPNVVPYTLAWPLGVFPGFNLLDDDGLAAAP